MSSAQNKKNVATFLGGVDEMHFDEGRRETRKWNKNMTPPNKTKLINTNMEEGNLIGVFEFLNTLLQGRRAKEREGGERDSLNFRGENEEVCKKIKWNNNTFSLGGGFQKLGREC